jgi:hypothetical protein
MKVLELLLRLRQACDHPALALKGKGDHLHHLPLFAFLSSLFAVLRSFLTEGAVQQLRRRARRTCVRSACSRWKRTRWWRPSVDTDSAPTASRVSWPPARAAVRPATSPSTPTSFSQFPLLPR